jgi:hypothetical protein
MLNEIFDRLLVGKSKPVSLAQIFSRSGIEGKEFMMCKISNSP